MDTFALRIQKLWKKYKVKKEFETNLFKKQMETFNTYFEKINYSNYNILTIKYLLNSDINDITIIYKKGNCYQLYNNDLFYSCSKEEVEKQLSFLNKNRILSMNIQCIVTDLNFYGYPEVFDIKVY